MQVIEIVQLLLMLLGNGTGLGQLSRFDQISILPLIFDDIVKLI
ncbi:hypothetical protein LYNGBM3L_62620 [Moorena producens 3L]|uniref:Uncharacterized protein n=1 Tax=Moorena producens 3L TaxID=489825 RepID=F4Y0S3_9CYAN|nr:hypothetical protein LYNGBM3L_62620 [Moorena producens 3L]